MLHLRATVLPGDLERDVGRVMERELADA